MLKLTIISTLLAAVSGSYPLAAPAYVGAPDAAYGYAASPYNYATPIVKAAPLPYATSYANTYKLSLRTPYVAAPVAYPAPIVKASPWSYPAYPSPIVKVAPLAYPAYPTPIVKAPLAYAAPVPYASYPYASPYAYGKSYGYY